MSVCSVELAGFEPASKQGTHQLSTCLVCHFIFDHRMETDTLPMAYLLLFQRVLAAQTLLFTLL